MVLPSVIIETGLAEGYVIRKFDQRVVTTRLPLRSDPPRWNVVLSKICSIHLNEARLDLRKSVRLSQPGRRVYLKATVILTSERRSRASLVSK